MSPTHPDPYPLLTIDESAESPFFVTLKIAKNSELRGCIGSLRPRKHADLSSYAIKSAFHDSRFPPLESEELEHLEVTVSLLIDFEPAKHPFDWQIGVHGIWLEFEVEGVEFSGTFLPEVADEQGWSQEETITALIRKAGYRKGDLGKDKWHALLTITRYQSSKATRTYKQWERVKKSFAGDEVTVATGAGAASVGHTQSLKSRSGMGR